MSRYQLTKEADNDLLEIWLHISQDDFDAAESVLAEMLGKFEILAAHPKLGRLRPELAPTIRSFPAGRYILFYRDIRGGVEIIRVLHGARDIDSIF